MLVIVGVSHRTAPLEIREALAFPKEGLPDVLRKLREGGPVEEAMILSTCNRVEVYGRAGADGSVEALAEFLAVFHGRAAKDLETYVYRLSGDEAVRHAFRVAASLDSMVIGEPQILGQVKEAYQIADGAGTLGSVLNALRNRSLASAKRTRSETGIGHNAVSVSYVAVELARKIFGELKERYVLLVGAGKLSELAA
jgi:glutamyl-tRNA reductase